MTNGIGRYIAVLCLIGPASISAGTSQTPALPTRAEMAPLVEAAMKLFMADGSSAVSIAVARDGETLALHGWGLADRDAKVAATAETAYPIGSVSKQFTAAAVLRLVERQRVGLTDAIGQHLPLLPDAWRRVTITQLLNHTSGIPDFTEIGNRWSRHWGNALSPGQIVDLVARDRMTFEPGTRWAYSNTGYVVLGMLIEKVYAKAYGDVIQEEFAAPLALSRLRVCADPDATNGQARGYRRDGDSFDNGGYRHVSHTFGAGGLCSTAGDLSVWNRALHGGKVVSAESYRLMTTPQGAAVGDRYGFGLMVESHGGRRVLTHTGASSGFSSINSWYPDERLSVTALTNTAPLPQRTTLVRTLAAIALGLPLTLPDPAAAPLGAAALKEYEGQYSLMVPGRPAAGLQFRVNGNVLTVQTQGQRAIPLHVVAAHVFGAAADPSIRITFIFENGAATKLVFEQAGAKFEAVRK